MTSPSFSSGSPPAHKDRRLLFLLALAMLLIGVAAGVELCRRLFLRTGPESLAGDFGFKLPPPASPEAPPEPAPPPPAREISAERFLTILAKETPRPVAKKFLVAFTRQPRLKQAFLRATHAGLAKTPARALLKALIAEPEFRSLVIESRSAPGFRAAFTQLARNPDVGGALRAGTIGLVRPPAGVTASAGTSGQGARPAPRARFTAAPPPTTLAETPEVQEGGSGDERGEERTGPQAHEVAPKLAEIEKVKGEQLAGTYLSSMFKEMKPEFRQYLEDKCDELKNTEIGCDPKLLCLDSPQLLQACKDACAKSPKCPPTTFDDNDDPP